MLLLLLLLLLQLIPKIEHRELMVAGSWADMGSTMGTNTTFAIGSQRFFFAKQFANENITSNTLTMTEGRRAVSQANAMKKLSQRCESGVEARGGWGVHKVDSL